MKQFKYVTSEPERDRFNRPIVTPCNLGEKPQPYTRVTTICGILDDPYSLRDWAVRQAVMGVAARPDLTLQVRTLGVEPQAEAEKKAWRQQIDEIITAGNYVAASDKAANMGTVIHRLAEQIDLNLQPEIPVELVPLMASYVDVAAGLDYVGAEVFVANDDFKYAGTADRIIRRDGKLIIADIKTGRTVIPAKVAQQCAAYAHSSICQPDNGARLPDELDTAEGLLIWLNLSKGTCETFELDLKQGWQDFRLALNVREAQTRIKKSMRTISPTKDGQPVKPAQQPADRIAELIGAAETRDMLVMLWQQNQDVWGPTYTDLSKRRLEQLETTK